MIVLGSAGADGKVTLIAGVTADATAKVKAGDVVNFVAQQVGGRGGGRPDLAQAGGTDAAAAAGCAAVSVQAWVRERLGALNHGPVWTIGVADAVQIGAFESDRADFFPAASVSLLDATAGHACSRVDRAGCRRSVGARGEECRMMRLTLAGARGGRRSADTD